LSANSLIVLTLVDASTQSDLEQLAPAKEDLVHTSDVYRLITFFAQRPADAVLIDLDFLTERDVEVFRVLREIRDDVFIFVLFSLAQREMAAQALGAGADAYLINPFYPSELTALLERAQRHRALSSKAEAVVAPDGRMQQMEPLARLAGAIAHEVNNPLATISGWVQMLLDECSADDPRRRTFGLLSEETTRIADVVRNLLAFSQQQPAQKELIDLNALITETIDGDPTLRREDAKVVQKLTPRLPVILGDPIQLRDACGHIFRAAMYGNGHREITVTTEAAPPEDVRLSVFSPKLVIPQKDRRKIFEPFFQPSMWGEGAGLGLAAAYGVVAGHGGDVQVASDERGGTLFSVTLPVNGGERNSEEQHDGTACACFGR